MFSLLLGNFDTTFTSMGFLLDDFLDNSDSNGLFHVSDSESTEWSILVELFNDHWFLWDHSN